MYRYILVLITAAFLVSCKGEENDQTSSVQEHRRVKTDIVKQEKFSEPVYAVGSLSSKTQSNLGFLTGGIISRYYVSEGDLVEKDRLIAQLDMTEIKSLTRQASLALEKARRDFKRVENLYKDTVVTLEQYQDAKTGLELAEENYRIAEFNLENSEIRAPADGKILKKLREVNEITASGNPVIVFASTEADWVLKVNLADKDIVRINTGDSALISFDAYPGERFSATVSEIASAANLLTGTYSVDLLLSERPDQLVTGLIGSARITPGAIPVLLLPAEALVEATNREGIVYTLVQGKAIRKEIGISTITDYGFIIRNGLNKGDTVITDGNAWIHDGDQVIVDNR